MAYQTLDPDLWARIRRGFAMTDLQNDLVAKHEQYYATRPAYIHRMTERSSKYLYHIVEELERRKMPTELALLPFIESAFNPAAVSTAKAAGMWQFIPSTGRDYSLKQNSFRDDRRDVLASTTAALDYLQRLYGMFGDWHLALAAYNWGEGSVGRAQAKNRRNDLPGGYTSLVMPEETRNYVPKLQAIKNIVANPAAFNAQLPPIPNHPYFKAVRIHRDIDVAVAARLAEVDINDFRSLNPSANKPVIFAAGTPTILLPWDNVPAFERNLKTHIGQTTGWMVWTAPLVAKVGELARKFGMSEDRFRQVNNIPPKMVVKPGSALLVPRPPDHAAEVSEHIADNGQLNLQPEVVLVKKIIRLRRAESVAKFAQRHQTTPAQVAQWNDISVGGSFKAKQAVVIYVSQQARGAGKRAGKADRSSPSEKAAAATTTGKSSSAKKAAKGQGGKATGGGAQRTAGKPKAKKH